MVGVISPLLLIPLSQEYIKAGAPDAAYFQTLGTLAIEGHYLAFQVAMIVLGPPNGRASKTKKYDTRS
jgi:hypothetical protein